MVTESTASVLSVRVSRHERELLEFAAAQARTNLSDYVRRNAVEAAEFAALDRRIVTIPAEKWAAFEAWANRPPQLIPALAELAASKPAWQD